MGMTDSGTYNETHMFHARGHLGIGNTNAFHPTAHINTGSYFKPDSNGKFLTVDGASHGAFLNLQSSVSTDNDQLGGIYFTDRNGQSDAHKQVAAIDCIVSDAGSENLDGADLRFFTKPAGSGTAAPRMTILANGYIGIGTNVMDSALNGALYLSLIHI